MDIEQPIQASANTGNQRLPSLLCIGAAKAGTTWLAKVLSAHPEIFIPPQKELNALHYDDLEDRLDEYMEYFRDSVDESVRGDFSVRYLNSPNAPAAAAKYVPDAKIILVVRNPVDQIQSHYWHLRRQNFHQVQAVSPIPDLFDALNAYPNLLLEPALYGKHLSRWRALFNDEQVLIIDFEKLINNQTETLDEICKFLEIEVFDFQPAIAKITASQSRSGVQPRKGPLGRIYPFIYNLVGRRGMLALKSVIGVQKTESIKRGLGLRKLGETVFFKSGYEKLEIEGRRRLWKLVDEDVALFGELSGLDVKKWEPLQ